MDSDKNNFVEDDFELDESKDIIYTDYNDEKIYDVNDKELSQEELINSINDAENGNFYTIEEMKQRFEEWKLLKFNNK